MWQADITVDKRYDIRKVFEKAFDRSRIMFTASRSKTRDIISIASDDGNLREELNKLILKILLVDMKFNYMKSKTLVKEFDRETSTLFSAMLFFDRKYEEEYVKEILSRQYEYSLDGIFNFKFGELKKNWDFVIDLYNNVYGSSEDIRNVTKYIIESGRDEENALYLTEKGGKRVVIDTKRGKRIDNISIYDEEEFNLIATLLYGQPKTLYIDKNEKFMLFLNLFEDMVEIKTV